jgi:hypothetical protein
MSTLLTTGVLMRRYSRTALAAVVGMATLLSSTGVAAAGSATFVPPNGTVAGKGYGYYVERVWQIIFESQPKHPDTCATVTVGSQQVAVIWPAITGSGTYKQSCTEPAGRPIYLQHVADECSTFNGDHAGYGTTDAQLKKCARADFKNATGSTTVDGHVIANMDSYIAASGAKPIDLTQGNYYSYKNKHGRSAAYGFGVLLRGLAAGTHKVLVSGTIPKFKFHVTVTYTLHVQ